MRITNRLVLSSLATVVFIAGCARKNETGNDPPASPPYAAAMKRAGDMLFDAKFNDAIREFDQVISQYPDLAAAYDGRGVAYAGTQQYEKAIADFTRAIKLDPSYAPAYTHRAAAYKATGNTSNAEADATAAEAKFGESRQP